MTNTVEEGEHAYLDPRGAIIEVHADTLGHLSVYV